MHITAAAISLNVEHVERSASFLKDHFAFVEEMSADGFVSLRHDDTPLHVIFLRRGLASLKPDQLRDAHADGLILAFEVDDIDSEYAHIQAKGVAIETPIETEPWGERYFQVRDPNGVIIQLVQWVHSPHA
ncbi:MAG TPA: VOC family protein [Roseiflexaceae bacterium]|nr:VOC family protein [Roseiflexaceae bacterium]